MNDTYSPQGSLTNEEYVARLNKCLDAGVQIVWSDKARKTLWRLVIQEVDSPILNVDVKHTDFLALLPGTSFDEWKANGYPIEEIM